MLGSADLHDLKMENLRLGPGGFPDTLHQINDVSEADPQQGAGAVSLTTGGIISTCLHLRVSHKTERIWLPARLPRADDAVSPDPSGFRRGSSPNERCFKTWLFGECGNQSRVIDVSGMSFSGLDQPMHRLIGYAPPLPSRAFSLLYPLGLYLHFNCHSPRFQLRPARPRL
jgi:hypothetical protein